MRQLVDVLNSIAGTAARLPSGLPSSRSGSAAVTRQQQQYTTAAALPPMSAAAAAGHPALRAAEAALASKLANNAAGCDQALARLYLMNEQLLQEGSFEAAEEHRSLNRYCDVLPYDDNRILLGQPAATHSDSSSSSSSSGGGPSSGAAGASAGSSGGYTNASMLHSSSIAGSSDYGVPWHYIAAQGPLKNTRGDFWQMVVEQRCSAVVMLTNTVERGVQKCWPYFAEQPKTVKAMGSYSVGTLTLEQLLPDLHRRYLVIKEQDGQAQDLSPQQRRHAVQHYHYTAWPDHGVPTSPEPLLRLCQELRSSGAHAAPILVHCSAGIGRSGVFCVLDIITRRLLRLLGSHDELAAAAAVDVEALVAQLRSQRLGMVQTRDQYVFCHAALLHFVRQLAAQQPEGTPAAVGVAPASMATAAPAGEGQAL